jgi:hypothetical protein
MPSWPQAVASVPGWQVPPLQQPPRQGWLSEHFVVQRRVVASHAECSGQSKR